MNKGDTLKLFSAGRDAWNEWAEKMLAEKKSLQEAGLWLAVESPMRRMPVIFSPAFKGQTSETSGWLDAACVDFKDHKFTRLADFSGFIFPGACTFEYAKFLKGAKFGKTTFEGDVLFVGARFEKEAFFEEAIFHGCARFLSVHFKEDGRFFRACFNEEATFDSSKFNARGWFGGSTFSRFASYYKVEFNVGAEFSGSKFERGAAFDDSDFGQFFYFHHLYSKYRVSFRKSTFGGWVNFTQSKFGGAACFDYVKLRPGAQLELNGVQFSEPPDFFGAEMSPPPRVDNIRVKVPVLGFTRDQDMSSRFRILKGFAIAHRDHDSELEFFAQEIRTARLHKDRLHSPRFWLGLIYEIVSNFGRSFARPFLLWLFGIAAFALYFYSQSPPALTRIQSRYPTGVILWDVARDIWYEESSQCLDGVSTSHRRSNETLSYAIALSRRNALVLPGIGRTAEDAQVYRCLYGVSQSPARTSYPVVPLGVSFWSAVQTIFSGIMLFLCTIALRNMLRMK